MLSFGLIPLTMKKEQRMSQQQQGGGSEVARLMQRIELEHEAACFALTSPALGTAQHWFITRRMEQIAACRVQLTALVGERATMEFLVQVTESAPAQPQEGAAHE